jgi:hypothetical protein
MTSRRLLALVLGVLALTASPRAHEIGTTRVTITTSGSDYQVEIATDAGALAEKLSAIAGSSATTGSSNPEEIESRLRAADEIFRRRVVLRFDGQPASPAAVYVVMPSRDAGVPPVAMIRLSGSVPAGAKTLTWSYGWTFATYSLRVSSVADATPASFWLEGGDTSPAIPLAAARTPERWAETAQRYAILGFTHIVPHGLDHMLFVIGIFLLTRRPRAILWQVSAFTVAHSITLALSLYDVVSIAPAVVEPLIALSIAYVAIENLLLAELKPRRVALVFAFGLLHGLGFAGALRDVGLPRSSFATALVGFNVGVELGQVAVIAVAMLAVGWYSRREWYRQRIVVPVSAAIACVAIYWMVERIAM